MTSVVNVCHGWACTKVTKCSKSDFNAPVQVNGWVRHYQSPQTGEHCLDFEPLRAHAWGEGADLDDE
jgi:hypothetical protein